MFVMKYRIGKKEQMLLLLLLMVSACYAQSSKQKHEERFVMDNLKQMTDASVSLYNVYSKYDFNYSIPSQEDITEKMLRICNYLEKSTMKEFVNPVTKEKIASFPSQPQAFDFGEGDYRPYTYEWGVTYSGMVKAAKTTGNTSFMDYTNRRLSLLSEAWKAVHKYMDKDKNYKSPIHGLINPHDLDACGALCAAVIQGKRAGATYELSDFIKNSLEFILHKQYRLEDGTLARITPYRSTLWMDDLYMSIPALAQGYLLYQDDKYLDDAVRQILQYSQKMFVSSTGLYMHSWTDAMEEHPAMYWGRANGWAVLAMCELLDVMPKDSPRYQEVLAQFKAHCRGLIKLQSKKGMWHQLLDREESYEESSCTAMFVYGLAHGINQGWLDAKAFGPTALLGWNGLSEQINNMGQIENVCVGTGVAYDPAYYCYRHVHPFTAHGYGPVLMAGSEMIMLINNFDIKYDSAIYFYDKKP